MKSLKDCFRLCNEEQNESWVLKCVVYRLKILIFYWIPWFTMNLHRALTSAPSVIIVGPHSDTAALADTVVLPSSQTVVCSRPHKHRIFIRWHSVCQPNEPWLTHNLQNICSEIHSSRNPKEVLIELRVQDQLEIHAVPVCVKEERWGGIGFEVKYYNLKCISLLRIGKKTSK